jgi:hypothetical protein
MNRLIVGRIVVFALIGAAATIGFGRQSAVKGITCCAPTSPAKTPRSF